ASAGSGLLSPPLAIKKVAAKSSLGPSLPPAGRIFLAGIITEEGELRELHAVRPEEVEAQIAIAALQQWQFEPAELNGQAVATKVLIGVTITNSDPRNAEKCTPRHIFSRLTRSSCGPSYEKAAISGPNVANIAARLLGARAN